MNPTLKTIIIVSAAIVVAALAWVFYDYGRIYIWGNDYDLMLSKLLKGSVKTVNPSEIADSTASYTFLDTRTIEEYRVSHIEGAKFIDFKAFSEEDIKDLDKTKPVIVYCAIGYRSEMIGEKLQKLGFQNVKNLYGGIFQWKNEGLPLSNRYGEPTDYIHGYSWLWKRWIKRGEVIY